MYCLSRIVARASGLRAGLILSPVNEAVNHAGSSGLWRSSASGLTPSVQAWHERK